MEAFASRKHRELRQQGVADSDFLEEVLFVLFTQEKQRNGNAFLT